MEFHLQQLGKHCRVCGRRLTKAKGKAVFYNCKEYEDQLLASFSFSLGQDSPEVHPSHFCQSCYCSMKRSVKATDHSAPFQTSKVTYEWKYHSDNCSVRPIYTYSAPVQNINAHLHYKHP